MRKIFIFLLILSLTFCSLGITAFAANDISPRLNTTPITTSSFTINSNGLAQVMVSCNCYDESFTYTQVSVVLEKRSLLVFWNDITEWEETSYDEYFNTQYTHQVDSGTYRVKITYQVFSTDGTSETVEETLKYTY